MALRIQRPRNCHDTQSRHDSPEYDAHVWGKIGNWTCLSHLCVYIAPAWNFKMFFLFFKQTWFPSHVRNVFWATLLFNNNENYQYYHLKLWFSALVWNELYAIEKRTHIEKCTCSDYYVSKKCIIQLYSLNKNGQDFLDAWYFLQTQIQFRSGQSPPGPSSKRLSILSY